MPFLSYDVVVADEVERSGNGGDSGDESSGAGWLRIVVIGQTCVREGQDGDFGSRLVQS